MAGSMKDIKLRIKSVESTMQITKAMELVASSKMRRAKERVEHSRPYFETRYESLTKIASAVTLNGWLGKSEMSAGFSITTFSSCASARLSSVENRSSSGVIPKSLGFALKLQHLLC